MEAGTSLQGVQYGPCRLLVLLVDPTPARAPIPPPEGTALNPAVYESCFKYVPLVRQVLRISRSDYLWSRLAGHAAAALLPPSIHSKDGLPR